jgi:hypothetical protein
MATRHPRGGDDRNDYDLEEPDHAEKGHEGTADDWGRHSDSDPDADDVDEVSFDDDDDPGDDTAGAGARAAGTPERGGGPRSAAAGVAA